MRQGLPVDHTLHGGGAVAECGIELVRRFTRWLLPAADLNGHRVPADSETLNLLNQPTADPLALMLRGDRQGSDTDEGTAFREQGHGMTADQPHRPAVIAGKEYRPAPGEHAVERLAIVSSAAGYPNHASSGAMASASSLVARLSRGAIW